MFVLGFSQNSVDFKSKSLTDSIVNRELKEGFWITQPCYPTFHIAFWLFTKPIKNSCFLWILALYYTETKDIMLCEM